jgi:hypothetical protein
MLRILAGEAHAWSQTGPTAAANNIKQPSMHHHRSVLCLSASQCTAQKYTNDRLQMCGICLVEALALAQQSKGH